MVATMTDDGGGLGDGMSAENELPADAAPGAGAQPRAASVVVWLAVVEALLLLTSLPAVVPLVLDSVAERPPLAALFLIPLGPAASAAIFAWRRFDGGDTAHPARHFWRGYRLNAVDVLKLWVPALVVLSLLVASRGGLDELQPQAAFIAATGVAAALAVGWTAHALVVASLFSFRARDTARMAGYFVGAALPVTLRALALAAVAVGVVMLGMGWVLPALGSVVTYLLWRSAQPVVTVVTRRFVVGAPDAVTAKPWPGLDGIAEPEDGAEDGTEDRTEDRTEG